VRFQVERILDWDENGISLTMSEGLRCVFSTVRREDNAIGVVGFLPVQRVQ